MDPRDLYPYQRPEISALIMWGAIVASALMVTITFAWQTGRQLRLGATLRDDWMAVCTSMHSASGAQDPDALDDAERAMCDDIVSARHDPCYAQSSPLREDYTRLRVAYLSCVMEEAHMVVAAPPQRVAR